MAICIDYGEYENALTSFVSSPLESCSCHASKITYGRKWSNVIWNQLNFWQTVNDSTAMNLWDFRRSFARSSRIRCKDQKSSVNNLRILLQWSRFVLNRSNLLTAPRVLLCGSWALFTLDFDWRHFDGDWIKYLWMRLIADETGFQQKRIGVSTEI